MTRPSRGKTFAAGGNRANRTPQKAAGTEEALIAGAGTVPGSPLPPSKVGVIALLGEISEAVRRGNRATVVVQAARACPHQEGALVQQVGRAEAEEAAEEEEAEAAAAGRYRKRRRAS